MALARCGFEDQTENVLECLDILFEMRADDLRINSADRIGRTPLSIAAFHGNTKAILFLLGKFAFQHKTDLEKRAPIHYAILNGHLDAIRVLLEHAESKEEGLK